MDRGQDARLLRAIGRAWNWRHRLERGDVTTIADLAREEGISDRYVSRGRSNHDWLKRPVRRTWTPNWCRW